MNEKLVKQIKMLSSQLDNSINKSKEKKIDPVVDEKVKGNYKKIY